MTSMTQPFRRLSPRQPLPLILILVMVSAPVTAQTPQPFVRDALQDLERAVGSSVQATVSPTTGLVTFLPFDPHQQPLVNLSGAAAAEERALAFLQDHGAAFGIFNRDSVSLSRVVGPDEIGMEHVRYRQLHRGVPVTGGELTVHLRGTSVVAVNAKTLPDLEAIEVVPALSPELAETRAMEALTKHLGITEAKLSPPRLELFNEGLLAGHRDPTRLAWFIEATGPALREFVWVDAERGFVLLHFSQLPDARDREIYDADDPSDGVYDDLPGVLVRSEGDPPTGDSDADLAYDYSGDTYDYFWGQHGRDSFDDSGATLKSTVHFCPDSIDCPYANAYWNGEQMVYGEGFPAADDVVVHEITHAFTEHSANLFYYMQSGALNESYSDIFGETVDLTNGSGNDSAAVRWECGEDVPGFGAVRDMMDPTLFGDPGKVSDSEFVCATPGSDGGGVHSNSGVPNHAYALMVDGGSYNGYTITGIDLTKAGKVQYRALFHYLLSASDFLDNYNAVRQSCTDLVGTAGITAGDCDQVDKALDAVEMYHPWPCIPAQAGVPFLCHLGGTPAYLFFDALENVTSGNWAGRVISGGDHWGGGGGDDGLYWQEFATSGVRHFWGWNAPAAGSSAVEMALNVAIPAGGALLQFNHSHGFESGASYYDGAVIEYSTDGGTTWNDAGSLIVAGANYGGSISTGYGNPLGGRSAFVDDSYGYTASQLDLSSLASQNVRIRFLVGTDVSVDDYGWFIDDVRFYTCSGAETLWDQTSSIATYGMASQEFEAVNAAYDCMAADDFVVPGAGAPWGLGGVHVPGHYSDLGYTPLVNVEIFNNSSGVPGTSVCSYSGLQAGIDFSDDAGDFSIRLPTSCVLAAGTYWLSVVADMDYLSRGQWYWTERTVQSGNPYVWKNPGDGFETGYTDWTPNLSGDTPPNPDLGFSLWKAAGVPNDLYLSNETVSATTTYQACNSITADDFHIVLAGDVTFQAGNRITLGDGFSVGAGRQFKAVLQTPAGCP
jgi:bacillolysin